MKIVITINDNPDTGTVQVVSNPSVKELSEIWTKYAERGEEPPASIMWTMRSMAELVKVSKGLNALDTDKEHSKKESDIWMPGLENVSKIWTPK